MPRDEVSALLERQSNLREEFVVCHAAGYPDPHFPHPNTLDNALRFAFEHRLSGVTGRPVVPAPVVKQRVTSDWEVVEDTRSPMDQVVASVPEQR